MRLIDVLTVITAVMAIIVSITILYQAVTDGNEESEKSCLTIETR